MKIVKTDVVKLMQSIQKQKDKLVASHLKSEAFFVVGWLKEIL